MEATFCFVDIAGYTALTEMHGAQTAADVAERFEALVQEALAGQGRIAGRAGDARFVVLPAPEDALGFLARLFAAVAGEPDFPVVRAGLHHGEAVERGGTYYGAPVNVAARVTAEARGGQVLGTAAVAAAARARGMRVTTLGPVALRNVLDPVEIFAIDVAGEDAAGALDPVCRMHVVPERAPARLRVAGRDWYFCSLECARRFLERPDAYGASGA